MPRETNEPTTRPTDRPGPTTRARFSPEFIAPYDEVIRLLAEIDGHPYRPADHWTQVLERLQSVADRPYDTFEYDDDLWIQRTPDIEEPLIVSGEPGDRSFLLMTATTEFVWTGDGWARID